MIDGATYEYPGRAVLGIQFAHQVDAVSIRQAAIGNQDVELMGCGGCTGIGNRAGSLDPMATTGKDARHEDNGIGVVIDHQDAQGFLMAHSTTSALGMCCPFAAGSYETEHCITSGSEIPEMAHFLAGRRSVRARAGRGAGETRVLFGKKHRGEFDRHKWLSGRWLGPKKNKIT